MMALDALEGCAKNPYKNRFFWHTLLLDAEEIEKQKKGPKKSNTQFLGGLENGQEVVPQFFSKRSGFSKSSKKPIFIAFPEKMGGNHCFSKRLCYKEDRLRGQKKINFLVPFRQKCLRRCQSKKRGGWRGRSPPQKGREKQSHGRGLVVFVVVGCCFCFFLVVVCLLFFMLLVVVVVLFLLLLFFLFLLLSLFFLLFFLLFLFLLLFFLLFLLLFFPQNTQRKKKNFKKTLVFFPVFLPSSLLLCLSFSCFLFLFPVFSFSSLAFPFLSFLLSLFHFLFFLFFLVSFLYFFLSFLFSFFFSSCCCSASILFVPVSLLL